MVRTRIFAGAALAAALAGAQAARAQTASFLGFRAEAQAGDDRFHSLGQHDDKFSYGGAVGFDGVIDDKIVIGPEFSYWRARGANMVVTPAGAGVNDKSFRELNAGVRVGYLFTPKLLGFVDGGYTSDFQRESSTGTIRHGGAFYRRTDSDGYQVGAGAEYALTQMFFVDVQYKYSRYHDNTAHERLMVGGGVRFK